VTDGEAQKPLSPAEVEQQIRRTRAELALTLDALERKLAARQFVEKGFDMLKDSFDGNDALQRGLDVIRANPVPVALIGIGAAWLIANNTGVVDRIAQDERVEAARRRVADLASDVGSRTAELATDVAGKIGLGGKESMGDRAIGRTGNPVVDQDTHSAGNGWMHQAAGVAQGALRTARDSGSEMLNRAGSYAEDGASRVAEQVNGAIGRNPLVIGAIGVMAGALLAALLPMTRFENELLGGTRDDLWHKAGKAGEQAVERARGATADAAVRAVDAIADAAAETARSVGDKPSQG
jgi:hypothetical protein